MPVMESTQIMSNNAWNLVQYYILASHLKCIRWRKRWQDCRMVEVKGVPGGHVVQTCCSSRVTKSKLPGTMSRWLLSVSKDLDSMSSLGNLSAQSPSQSVYKVTKCFLMLRWNISEGDSLLFDGKCQNKQPNTAVFSTYSWICFAVSWSAQVWNT